jgi:hypothetical protein
MRARLAILLMVLTLTRLIMVLSSQWIRVSPVERNYNLLMVLSLISVSAVEFNYSLLRVLSSSYLTDYNAT